MLSDLDAGMVKPYRLPQSSWAITRTVFAEPTLVASFDRISPQFIEDFKLHPSFQQLKDLTKKRTVEEVKIVSVPCGFIWGWAQNTLICADISVNIDG
jgi:hypothetical protein